VASGRAYLELRQAILRAGLLERAYGYYVWRTGVSFGLLGVALGLSVALPAGLPGGLLASAGLAFGSVQVALIGHDAGHLAVFRSARANWALGALCWSLTLGVGFGYWSDRHNRHHASTNDLAADPDLQWAGLVAYSETAAHLGLAGRRARWLRRYQAILGPLYTLSLAFAFRVEGWSFALRALRGRRRALEVGLLGTSLIGWLLPVLVLGPAWLAIYVLGQVLAGLYLALAIAPNHKGMPIWPNGAAETGAELGFLDRQVRSSRNVRPHPITDFVLGGLNYQIEHHLFPSMPRVHLRRARQITRPFCQEYGLPYTEMGLFASYRLVLAELQRVGRTAAAAEWG